MYSLFPFFQTIMLQYARGGDAYQHEKHRKTQADVLQQAEWKLHLAVAAARFKSLLFSGYHVDCYIEERSLAEDTPLLRVRRGITEEDEREREGGIFAWIGSLEG